MDFRLSLDRHNTDTKRCVWAVSLPSGLVHKINVHVQTRVVASEDGFEVSRLKTLSHAPRTEAPEGSIHVLPPESKCQGCHAHVESWPVVPVSSVPKGFNSLPDVVGDRIQHSVWKKDVNVGIRFLGHGDKTA